MDKLLGVVIAAMLILAGVYVVQDNYVACQTALCKKVAREKLRAEKAEREFALKRKDAEAERTFGDRLAASEAARERADFDVGTRRIEAQAKIDREREIEIARINADKEARIAKNAVDLAKIQGETRVGLARAEGRREGGGLIGMMCRNGMGRCGQRPQQRMVRCSPRHGNCPRGPQRARGYGPVVPYAAVPSYVRVVGPGHSRGY